MPTKNQAPVRSGTKSPTNSFPIDSCCDSPIQNACFHNCNAIAMPLLKSKIRKFQFSNAKGGEPYVAWALMKSDPQNASRLGIPQSKRIWGDRRRPRPHGFPAVKLWRDFLLSATRKLNE